MARLARVVAPGLPHHITQRGNRRQQTFFCDEDYQSYLELMAEWCAAHEVEIWAYCLMPNHVHLIAVPHSADGLRRAIGEVHRRYTRMVNFREGWRGHLWQGRFASFVLDEPYLLTAARYVELNPVRAGLIKAPSRYRWSSAAAHVRGRDDALVRVAPLAKLAPNWRGFLARVIREEDMKILCAHERTGRPLGEEKFLATLEQKLGRILRRQKPGPKRRPPSRRTRGGTPRVSDGVTGTPGAGQHRCRRPVPSHDAPAGWKGFTASGRGSGAIAWARRSRPRRSTRHRPLRCCANRSRGRSGSKDLTVNRSAGHRSPHESYSSLTGTLRN